MRVNSLVVCILGYPGVLETEAIYTVREVTARGNINVFETFPPHPHTCFNKERFIEAQSPDEIPEILFEVLAETMEN